ncbi:Transcriptional regulator GlxA family, contains an amidase domain and an AraC-type DNA-binding HTH domain [Nitrosospira briensis]|uniref:Transcriptional regulator GlxA family, contains an amidase domain and an AraC-type DNA-binding HTH domain n=1 Tax=Nitrosospira briensis TaxID=35799 RepID=A0A1I5F1F4_9PROT|nr:helix-turn-helix domain-containing protein [Nitrosospira briensis]SFO17547.1 Transcriptional regulator GlxA family, contains an amidase domain and an AraC-type DNA-binding HTH domain [Nitrosospira briensis]
MRIHILALDEVFDTGLSTLLDTLNIANDLASSVDALSTRFTVTVIGMRRRIRTSHGFTVPIVATSRSESPDVVLIPALGAKMPETLELALKRKDVRDAGSLLRELAGAGTLVGAACTGTFVLADTSLLEGRSATTSWWLAPLFRERYPGVRLEESRMVISSSGFVTAGAALAHIDLALWLIRRSSPTLAELTARFLLIEPRSSQAVFAIPDHLSHADTLVQRFELWARCRLGKPFSLGDAAIATGSSERTLSRRLQAVVGKSPLSYFQDLRVERAIHLLRTSSDNVDSIAAQVGYADGATLRSLLRRKTGRPVSALRIPPWGQP